MTTTTRNEAAEWLLLGPYTYWARESWEGTEGIEAALCTAVAYFRATLPYVIAEAKAEGAREAVERIRAAMTPIDSEMSGNASATLNAFLQDERESSLGRDTEGHLVLTLGPGSESPSRKGEQE